MTLNNLVEQAFQFLSLFFLSILLAAILKQQLFDCKNKSVNCERFFSITQSIWATDCLKNIKLKIFL